MEYCETRPATERNVDHPRPEKSTELRSPPFCLVTANHLIGYGFSWRDIMRGSNAFPGSLMPDEASWRNIEPVLKWAGVAYMFGFLIIMVHTYRLGIPTLQLVEPINIWIGAPLAVVAFFLDKIYVASKRAVGTLVQSLKEAGGIREQFDKNSDNLEDLFLQIVDFWLGSLALFAAPFGLAGPMKQLYRRAFRAYINLVKRIAKTDPLAFLNADAGGAGRERLLNSVAPTLKWTLRVAAVAHFVNVAIYIVCIFLACWLYVEVFPSIPQTLGGGRPLAVELLVSPDMLPQGKEFEGWRTEGHPSLGETKGNILVPVTLYFHGEHELIVRKGAGPIVSLGDHAVEGIVFPAR
jgi:hypothetical protein